MAEKATEGVGEVAAKTTLTAAQKQLNRRRQELDYWKKNSERIRGRNLFTGLAIGAFVIGMCILLVCHNCTSVARLLACVATVF